jgi:hypothetical protein
MGDISVFGLVLELAEPAFLRINVGTRPFVDRLIQGVALPVGVQIPDFDDL